MLISVGVILVGLAIAIREIPYLKKNRLKKEAAVFWILLIAGTGLGVALGMKLPLPNPLDWIIMLYKPISDALHPWLAD
ncbi:hypothetical protein [Paenibacillus sp. J2TS4]|uniref:hypothetical protein n=1 Tax=Paenibacillus sp. J2TS4 TaxID=2807194 RepID=UPI001B248600|nr:hypothetical protein [Paenibacillus sp. J2TS4]GIP32616.1 hypothetical protein J2TS4_18260 [Paenibacillus sp. J2TS4]